MSTTIKHISDLLFEQECVIIPGFGALLSRYYPAEINAATHMMRPPSRRLAFNSRITDNDGSLANFISRRDDIGYSEALAGIEILVRSWTRMLQSGKKVNLPGIGRFYLDGHEKLQFSPSIDINYHKESFGLSIFRANALQKEVSVNQGIDRAIDDYHREKNLPAVKPLRRIKAYRRWAAVLTPFLALGLAAGIYFQNHTPYPFLDYASFSPFTTSPAVAAEPEENVENSPVLSPETTAYETVEELTPDREIIPAEAEAPAVVKAKFHIVVGSFREEKNAENYVAELRNRGYDAYVAKGDQHFSRVAIGHFNTHDSAATALLGIKNNLNPGSWIYSN